MKKTIYSLLLMLSSLYAIDIDTDFVKKRIADNPEDTNYRMVLVKYYLQNSNLKEAQRYIDEIKKIDPSDKRVDDAQRRIFSLKNLQSKLNIKNIRDTEKIQKKLHKLYLNEEYENFINIYENLTKLNIALTNETHLDAALSYAETNRIHKSRLLIKIKEFKKSPQLLALKIRLALFDEDISEAKKLFGILDKKYPSYKGKSKISRQIEKAVKKETRKIKKRISQKGSFKALGEYVYLQTSQKKPNLAIKAVKNFLKNDKNHFKAKLLLAKLYYWNGKTDNALSVLQSLKKHTNEKETLLANILYEKGEYKKALKYLKKASGYARNPKERYFLQKREAFAYAFTGNEKKSSTLFKKLLGKNPDDPEILKFQKERGKELLLKKAIDYHKQKDMQKALHYYKKYYEKYQDEKIAREIAEICYFDKNYDEAIKYFKIYISSSPDDNLILFHLATSYEKKKKYKKAASIFKKIIRNNDPELYYLSSYHYAHSLLRMQKDKEWLEARRVLQKLSKELQKRAPVDKEAKKLAVHVNSLLKLAMKPVQKPTYYKDIVLTEGATKIINRADVFSDVDIAVSTKPTLKMLLHNWEPKKEDIKPKISFAADYVSDSSVSYLDISAGVEDIVFTDGVRYSAKVSRFYFDFKHKTKTDGNAFYINAQKGRLTFGAGVEKFENFNTFTPKITWSPVYGSHSLYIDLYYRNGSFANYKSCMIENETALIHAGIYDRILFDDLSYMELLLSLNSYSDENRNIYALINYPLFSFTDTKFDIEHKVIFNENFEYNSKTDLCYELSKTYESSYIKYQPEFNFQKGYLQLSLGSGYSFKNSESISSFAIKGQYTIDEFATFELNCERVRSSFTPEGMNYCSFVVSQIW